MFKRHQRPPNSSPSATVCSVVPGLDPQPAAWRSPEVLQSHPLPRLIYPCRSLCEAVKRSCAPVMACYGYPWPEILNCSKFPADHELCIAAVSTDENSSSRRSKLFFIFSCYSICNTESSKGWAYALFLFLIFLVVSYI